MMKGWMMKLMLALSGWRLGPDGNSISLLQVHGAFRSPCERKGNTAQIKGSVMDLVLFFHIIIQEAEVDIEAYPLLEELTSKISTLNLEHVRQLKSRLVALTRRVQNAKD